MKTVIATIIALLISATSVYGVDVNYTSRSYTQNACELFAHDVYQASSTYKFGIDLPKVLRSVENMTGAESKKHRAFEAIQFVWKNQLDNPTLAYSLALGLCLPPKRARVPLDQPYMIDPRTAKPFF